jgi:hypothetical protein
MLKNHEDALSIEEGKGNNSKMLEYFSNIVVLFPKKLFSRILKLFSIACPSHFQAFLSTLTLTHPPNLQGEGISIIRASD